MPSVSLDARSWPTLRERDEAALFLARILAAECPDGLTVEAEHLVECIMWELQPLVLTEYQAIRTATQEQVSERPKRRKFQEL